MIKLWVVSLGCNKTLVDTQNLLWSLISNIKLCSEQEADFILLNTCSFLKSARDEVKENLDLFNDKKVILVWCYTKFASSDIFDDFPQVWAVVPSNKYAEIENVLNSIIDWKRIFFDFEIEDVYLEMPESVNLTLPHVSYIKISEGCDNTCTYCTIPRIRWPFRSRKSENILNEVKSLIDNWCKEIILTSQDTWYYWREKGFKGDLDFTWLLEKIVKIKWDFKIRFLYMYPERINDKLLNLIASNKKILDYFDIPFQHVSKDVLIKMKRPFWKKLLWDLVNKIRKKLPDSVIRTTFIVWFPWESQKDFKLLCEFVQKYKIERIWIFKYSNEKWSESFDFSDQVSEEIKDKRYEKLSEISREISLENNKKLVDLGQELTVIIDSYDQWEDSYICRSYRECLEVDPLIYVASNQEHEIWDEMNIKIIWCDDFDLYGQELVINI